MANDGNQIGQVSVGVTAVGVEETNRKLDSVAAHAKQTARAVSGAAGGTTGLGPIAGEVGDLTAGFASGKASAQRLVDAEKAAQATEKAAAKARTAAGAFGGVGTELRGVLRLITSIGAVGFIFDNLIKGALGFSNAARDVSNSLRDIHEGFKVNTNVGLSSFEQLTIASNEYHLQEKRKLDIEADTAEEALRSFIDGNNLKVDLTTQGLRLELAESQILIDKRKELEKGYNAEIITHEKNASDFRIKNLDRQTQMVKAVTAVEKANLEEKIALEDEERNRAVAFEASKKIEDQKSRDEAQKGIDEQSAKERAAIQENAKAKRTIAQREQDETIRQYQAAGARAGASRFGPGNTDLNTLILKNISQTLQAYGQMSRRF